jgi:isoleucyl-tRNA synthetase
VRRSRDRFWSAERDGQEKLDAYWTLYECLLTTSKLIAPLTPFLAETMWQNLTAIFQGRTAESVHLCDYPQPEAGRSDSLLSEQMIVLREIASLGRSARMEASLKVRQPLARVEVILGDARHQAWLQEHDELLKDELNVKEVAYAEDAEQYIEYQVVPNFKKLGPRVGKLMPAVKKTLMTADGGALLGQLNRDGHVSLDLGEETIQLDKEDIEVRLQAREGWAASQGQNCVVVLATELTPELLREGHARDLVRLIQERRKELDCQFTDRIEITLGGTDGELSAAVTEFSEYIQRETLANSLDLADSLGAGVEHEVAGMTIGIEVRVAEDSGSESS